MRKLLFRLLVFSCYLISTLFIALPASGQSVTSEGRVVGADGSGIAYAVVSLVDSQGRAVSNSVTEQDGTFSLSLDYSDSCSLAVSHLAYKTLLVPLEGTDFKNLKIVLTEKAEELGEVVVETKKPLLEMHNGNFRYNVDQVKHSDVLNLARIMNRLPGVTASEREGITLNGTAATVYIDGIEQRLPANAVLGLLQGLPASSVSSVELVMAPGADVRAGASAVAIKIETKKLRLDGYYLFAGGDALYDDNNKLDGSLNATYIFKKKRVTFNAYAKYSNHQNMVESLDSTYYNSTQDYLLTDALSYQRSNVLTALANLNLDVGRGNRVNFNVMLYEEGIRSHYDSDTYFSRDLSKSRFHSSGKGHDDLFSATVEYSSNDTLRHSVRTSYGYVSGGVRDNRHLRNYYMNDDALEMRNRPKMQGHQHTGKINYTFKPSTSLSLETGARLDVGKLTDDVHYSDFIGVPHNAYTNTEVSGTEIITGLFATLRYNLNPSVSFYAGVRAEHTDFEIKEDISGESVKNKYWNVFPAANVSFKIGEKFLNTFWLSTGITRPNYMRLLPGEKYANDYSYSRGNPDLKVSKFYMASLTSNYSFLTLNLQYYRINDVQSTVSIDQGNGVTLRMPMNYADIDGFNATLNGEFSFFDSKLSGNVSMRLSYRDHVRLGNGFQMPENGNKHFWNSSIGATLWYDPTDRFGIEVSGKYNFKSHTMQTTAEDYYYINMGLRYSPLKDDKISFLLDFVDVFNTISIQRRSYYDGAASHNRSNGNRYLSFTVNFKFSGGENVRRRARNVGGETDRFSKE